MISSLFSCKALARLGFFCVLLAATPAMATDANWVGNVSNDFTNSANWNPSGPPNGTATFDNTVVNANPIFNSIGGTITLDTISVAASAPAMKLILRNASTLTLNGTGVVNASATPFIFQLESSSAFNLTNSATLANSVMIMQGGQLYLNTSGVYNAELRNNLNGISGGIILASGITVTWAGAITEVTASKTLHISGPGTFHPTNNTNSYSGGTAIDGGAILLLDSDAELGSTTCNPSPYCGITLGSIASPSATSTGTIKFNAAFGISSLRPMTILSGGAVIDTNGFDTTIGSTISGSFSIFGYGSLTKIGAGTLTLTGANVYDGDTIVTAGTLQLGNGGTNGSIIGAINGPGNIMVASGATFAINRSDNLTFTNAISGAGNFRKMASNTVIITGNQTHTGTTSIQAGTLQAGATGIFSANSAFTLASGSTLALNGFAQTIGNIAGSGNVTLGSATLTAGDTNASTLFSGVIADSGGVTKVGSGTLTLTGTNTYTGITTISAGTLQLGDGSTSGSVAGAIVNNATLAISRSDDLILANIISGSGAVNKLGANTLTVTGDNSFTGITTISSGSLQIGNGGATGVIGGPIANNAALIVNRSNAVTLIGSISGTGTLTQTGSGTLTLSGANTYSGATAVNAATLQAGAANTFSSASAHTIASGATLALANLNNDIGSLAGAGNVTLGSATLTAGTNNGTTTFSGVISGTGGLTKAGTGTLTLTGANTYSGATTITGGTLVINGSITNSTVALSGSGQLKGSGSLGNVTAQTGTTIAPGNSIGTLNVTNISFAAGSIYEVETNAAGASDLINASGTATLTGGTVQVLTAAEGYSLASTYTILTAAGGVNGTFTNVVVDDVALRGVLSYTAGSVRLNIVPVALPAAANSNQAATRAAITAGGFAGNTLFNALATATTATAQSAYDLISGEIHAILQSSIMDEGLIVRRALIARSHAANKNPEVAGAWVNVSNSWGQIGGNGNAAEASRDYYQLTVGIDRGFGTWLLGIAGGYGREDLKVVARASSAKLTQYHIGAYASANLDVLNLRAGFSQMWGNTKTARSIVFTTINDATSAKQDIDSTQIFAEAGYPVTLGEIMLEPFAGLAWMRASAGSVRETGGAAALLISGADSDGVYSTLGLQAEKSFGKITPSLRAAWLHDFQNGTVSRDVAIASTGQAFTVLGTANDANRFLIDAGFTAEIMPQFGLSIGYRGILSTAANDNAVRADLGWRF